LDEDAPYVAPDPLLEDLDEESAPPERIDATRRDRLRVRWTWLVFDDRYELDEARTAFVA
jgi:hypothetical protein